MIGPQIPAHLLTATSTVSDSDNEDGPQKPPSIGPQIPTRPPESKVQVFDDDDDDEGPQPSLAPSIGPSIPPEILAASKPRASKPQQVAGPSKPPQKPSIGPSLPRYGPTYNPSRGIEDDDSDDDDIGPKPLPAGMHHEETDAVKEFLASEEKRRKLAEVWLFSLQIYLVVNDGNRKLQNQRSLNEKNGCSFHQHQLAFSQVRLIFHSISISH